MRLPPFAVTYVVAGAACLIFGFRRHKSLLALGALLISIATINAYIEEWPSSDHGNFASVAPALLFVFMLAYTALTMSLAEKVGGKTFSRRFVVSMLPFLYLLLLGVVIELPHFGDLQNPPLALYLCIILTVVLHVPAFAGGKSKFQSRRSSANGVADAGMRKLLQTTSSILAAPLFAIFHSTCEVRRLDIVWLQRNSDCGCRKLIYCG